MHQCSEERRQKNEPPAYGREMNVTLLAVATACHLAITLQTHLVISNGQTRANASLVNVADHADQALVIHCLRNAFPNSRFITKVSLAILHTDEALLCTISYHFERSYATVSSAKDACEFTGGDVGGAVDDGAMMVGFTAVVRCGDDNGAGVMQLHFPSQCPSTAVGIPYCASHGVLLSYCIHCERRVVVSEGARFPVRLSPRGT